MELRAKEFGEKLGHASETPVEALSIVLNRALRRSSFMGEWTPDDFTDLLGIAWQTSEISAEIVLHYLAESQELQDVLKEAGWTITPPSPCNHHEYKYVHGVKRCKSCGIVLRND